MTTTPVCDATLDTDDQGKPGHFTAITTDGNVSVPVGACSDDRVTIWHGMSTPAVSCGRHASGGIGNGPALSVFRGHRNRIAAAA